MQPKYKRILLKLSGESLMGDKNFGLDPEVLVRYAQEIKQITEMGVQVAIVIGGGNIYRGMNEAYPYNLPVPVQYRSQPRSYHGKYYRRQLQLQPVLPIL